MTRVVLHIERLVLRGVAVGERDALVASLQQTLTSLLSERADTATLHGLDDQERLRAGFVGTGGPASVGAAAAQAVVQQVMR